MTTETKPAHTPGPWIPDDMGDDGCQIIGDNAAICSMHRWECAPFEQDANARLIASAPELLEALEAARPVVRNAANEPDASPWQRETRQAILCQLETAIANARGEE